MAKSTYEGVLIQNKGSFQLRGIIVGKNPDTARKGNGYTEAKTKKDQKPYRSIKFLVKTSEDNIVPVELFGTEMEFAYAYNKTVKNTLKLAWKERNNKLPDGYNLIDPDFDKAKTINDDFKDGDGIVIVGEIQFSEYLNPTTQEKNLQKKYVIKQIYPATEPIDLNDENYEEECYFIQECVIRNVEEVKKENRLYISAWVIGYAGSFNPAQFEVDTETTEKTFANNMKGLKFGDFIKLTGNIQNRAIGEEVSEDDGWGKKKKATTSYWKALEVTGAYGETLEKKKYTEKDFVVIVPPVADIQATLKKIEESTDSEDLPFDLD